MVLRWSFSHDGRACVLELSAQCRDWRWTVRAGLSRDGEPQSVPIPEDAAQRAEWTVEPGHALYHLDIPGVVSATLAPPGAGGQARCLFASTPLLRALGIPGGRYELLSASLISA